MPYKGISMKKILVSFLLVNCFAVLSAKNDFGLFEFYWKEKPWDIHFAALSESVTISEENHEEYLNFKQQCLEKKFESLLLYYNRRKTMFFCSDDEKSLEAKVKQQKTDDEKSLASFADFIKSGKVADIKKVGNANSDAVVGLLKPCLEWDAKSSLLVGYAIQSHIAEEKNGVFNIEGCDVLILHIRDGVVDHSKN